MNSNLNDSGLFIRIFNISEELVDEDDDDDDDELVDETDELVDSDKLTGKLLLLDFNLHFGPTALVVMLWQCHFLSSSTTSC
jgi:hypothetical protein